jgi:hypothetical protein
MLASHLSCQDAISNEGHLRPLEWTALFAILSSSSSAQVPCRVQWRFHLNEGESSCRRRLCQPPSSARQPQLFLRLPPLPTSGQCSSVSRPALLPCTVRAHGGGYSLCPPPGSVCQEGGPAVFAILLSSSSAQVPCRAQRRICRLFFYRPAVIVSLSSSSETVPHRAQERPHLNEGGHRRCLRPPPRSILSSSSARVEEGFAVLAILSFSSSEHNFGPT